MHDAPACRHLDGDSRISLRAGSLQTVHHNLRQHMHIDAASVAALEIIDPTPQAGGQKKDSSLYRWQPACPVTSALNHCADCRTACTSFLQQCQLQQMLIIPSHSHAGS
jgi:hypothetical protein